MCECIHLNFLRFVRKVYHVGIQRETNRNNPRQFREGFLSLPSIKSGRSRPHQHTSKWLKHFVEWKISSIEPSGCEHKEVQFSSHRRSVVLSTVSDNSHPLPWEDCWISGHFVSLFKVKAILAQSPMRKFSCLLSVGGPNFVNVSLLKKNTVTFASFFTLCTDESMCAMRCALSVPIQMWKSTFMSWSFMSVLASVSVSMIRSSFQGKLRGGPGIWDQGRSWGLGPAAVLGLGTRGCPGTWDHGLFWAPGPGAVLRPGTWGSPPHLAKPNHIWPKLIGRIWPTSFGAQFLLTKFFQTAFGQFFFGGPKGWARPKGWGPEGWGAQKLFFSLRRGLTRQPRTPNVHI